MKDNEPDLGTGVGESKYSPASKDSEGNFYAPDIHEAAERAIISGTGAIAQGRAAAAGEKGVYIGAIRGIDTKGGAYIEGSVNTDESDFVGRDRVIITYDTAFERVIGSTAFVLNQLELSYTQTRETGSGLVPI